MGGVVHVHDVGDDLDHDVRDDEDAARESDKWKLDVQELGPGIQELVPGIRGSGPGIQELWPGIRELGPDIQGLGPGIRGLGPGIRGLEPGIPELVLGIQAWELDNLVVEDIQQMVGILVGEWGTVDNLDTDMQVHLVMVLTRILNQTIFNYLIGWISLLSRRIIRLAWVIGIAHVGQCSSKMNFLSSRI